MDAARASWISQAEAALKGLRDVEGVVIQNDGEEISEIHVVSSSRRPAKQIVRDVQTLLLARFHRAINYRIVSVAFLDPDDVGSGMPEPVPVAAEAAPTVQPGLPPSPAAESADHRIRFRSANLFVTGPRLQAQVDFQWKGLPRTGSASGHGTRDAGHRLIAQAVLLAIQDFLEEDIALALEGLEFSRVGARDVAVVNVQLVTHREHKNLVGCCTVEQDVPQAVALATLAAVNRVLGGLPTREPTEYVLRPTSM